MRHLHGGQGSCHVGEKWTFFGGGGGFGYLNSPCIGKSITLMFMSSNERWVPVFVTKLRDRCFCWLPAAMLVPLRWTPTFLLISRRWKIAPIWILAIVLAYLTPLISQILDLFLMACQLKLAIDKKDEVQSDQLAIGASLIKYLRSLRKISCHLFCETMVAI